MRKNKLIRWNIPAPKILDDALEAAVRTGTHSTKSDFIRDVVRRKLESIGFNFRVNAEDGNDSQT